MRFSNYDKFPSTKVCGEITEGWDDITDKLSKSSKDRNAIIAVDLYPGADEFEIAEAFSKRFSDIIMTRDLMKDEKKIREMTEPFMTDDVLFGHVTALGLEDYFDDDKIGRFRSTYDMKPGQTVVIGTGAAMISPARALVIYADMARREIQLRFRRHMAKALGIDNSSEPVSVQYKRGYFNDWRICDDYKSSIFSEISYWLDTNVSGKPKMIDSVTFMSGIEKTVKGPFRVVPFFDPAPWGGQWMKEICDLDRQEENFGWCFDCVPEENSLYFNIREVNFEVPAMDLVLLKSKELLGEAVEARFGKDFPIRFDFLDTMGGGNLSLQVHPTTQFINRKFGIHYTQDESYYILDAGNGASVFLGLKSGINPLVTIDNLKQAQHGVVCFDTEKYVNRLPAVKHDHFLIPAGTVHCSGAGTMVLEISATPNLFTFKLWDWQRLGLDGKPRPINIERGESVIAWERNTEYVGKYLHNSVCLIAEGNGWREERTGLHRNEFIETRRHWFSVPVRHSTCGSVNVLNLVEGEEVAVSSPDDTFDTFIVHYAETFIIPEHIKEYIITPYGQSSGKLCATVKAFVRC